jgi:hypothetical protein
MIEKQFELLQNIIDRCTKHDYDAVKEAFSMKKAYLNAKHRSDYIRKEIFRITEELVSMNQQIPALKAFAFDWKTPNFIWETTFIENLLPEARKKYTCNKIVFFMVETRKKYKTHLKFLYRKKALVIHPKILIFKC